MLWGASVGYLRAPEGSLGSRAFEEGGSAGAAMAEAFYYGVAEVEGGGDDGDLTEKPRPGRCGAVARSNKLGWLSSRLISGGDVDDYCRGRGSGRA